MGVLVGFHFPVGVGIDSALQGFEDVFLIVHDHDLIHGESLIHGVATTLASCRRLHAFNNIVPTLFR